MNICKYDIYFIIVLILIIYLYWNQTKIKETFQSTTTGYQADIEAIRNLSNIATKLTTNNSLTMPGVLNVSNNLNIGDPNCPSGGNIAPDKANGKMLTFDNSFNGTAGQGIPANKIRLHDNNNGWLCGLGLESNAQTYHSGGSHRFYVGSTGPKYGDLALTVDAAKNVVVSGNTTVSGGRLYIGNSADGISSTITDSVFDQNSLCIVGQGVGPNRKVHLWDHLYIDGNLMLNTFYRKYMNAGVYQVIHRGYATDLKYGWTLLWSSDENTHKVAARLSLYEKTKGTNAFVISTPYNIAGGSDDEWQPHRLVLFPGYCARFYYWSEISTNDNKFNSGYYEWVDKKFPLPSNGQCPIIIHVTLESEGISNFDDLTAGKLAAYSWKNAEWNNTVFPYKLPNHGRGINESGYIGA